MQYPVPQFIDIEDKIIGPFTMKQFGFIFLGGVIIVALFRLLQLGFLFYLLSIPIAIIDLFVSFGRFNGRPIYNTFPIIIKFLTSDRAMIFQQQQVILGNINIQPLQNIKIAPETHEIVEPVHSRLKKLSMLLDQKNQEEISVLGYKAATNNAAAVPETVHAGPVSPTIQAQAEAPVQAAGRPAAEAARRPLQQSSSSDLTPHGQRRAAPSPHRASGFITPQRKA